MLLEEQRPGLKAKDHERTKHNGCSAGTGNAQSHHRNEGAYGAGVVGCFRCGKADDLAFSKILRVLCKLFFIVVSHKTGDRSSCAGKYPDKETYRGLAYHRPPAAFELCHCDPYPAELFLLL